MVEQSCDVCGRTEKQIKSELNLDASIVECFGIEMCEKCRSEYRSAHDGLESEEVIPDGFQIPEGESSEPVKKTDKDKDYLEKVTA